jgi:thiol-disulfide isomerase/thioredoxin
MTKKISLFILLTSVFFSCAQKQPKDFISLEGKIENNKDSTIVIISRTEIIKSIEIKEDGTFKDTLKVENAGIFTIQTSNANRAPIYLKNGFDLAIKANTENFMESFELEGKGANNSKFILSQLAFSQNIGNPSLFFELEKEAFNTKIDALEFQFDSILNSYKDLDSVLVNMASSQTQQMVSYFKQNYATKQLMKRGTPSPTFENYVDYNGGKKSLASFKGKYVYIDLWATWCGPCIQQIPFLKILEKEYHSKNIEFVSISSDEARRSGGSWEAAEKKWRDFVKAKNLTGVQLWSGQDISFHQAYQVTGIPRFILLDKEGKIIDANAPRPSDPALKDLLNSLDL